MTVSEKFAADVRKGLSQYPKSLPSKYFYDSQGDSLFQQIMDMEEYYLPQSETWIFRHTDLYKSLIGSEEEIEIVELGAGDGRKSRILLNRILKEDVKVRYRPIDISSNILQILGERIQSEFPNIDYSPLRSEYFSALHNMEVSAVRRIITFMGSSIGNLHHSQAVEMMKLMQQCIGSNGELAIAFDLKKDPELIRAAYNDRAGITRRFNLNLLTRVNKELDADFNISLFKHAPVYDPESGVAKSFLLSIISQRVSIGKLDMTVSFHPWESIHTEISHKYDYGIIQRLAEEAGLELTDVFYDDMQYYAVCMFRGSR